jgi:hypothetical protein
MAWRKSSRSGMNANCVEINLDDMSAVRMRDSKDPGGAVLAFGPENFAVFLADVKRGGLDRDQRQ